MTDNINKIDDHTQYGTINRVSVIDTVVLLSPSIQLRPQKNNYIELAAEIKQMWKINAVRINHLMVTLSTLKPFCKIWKP